MKRSIAWAVRCIVWAVLSYALIHASGFAGLIDFLQLAEVLLTALGMGLIARACLKKRGLLYFMEWTSLAAGILWMGLNLLLMWKRYGALEQMMLCVSALSVWDGLLLSLCNSWLIGRHIKKKEKMLHN